MPPSVSADIKRCTKEIVLMKRSLYSVFLVVSGVKTSASVHQGSQLKVFKL